jgi:CRP/FNR family transcriptional regulator, cyclic AMP receptor protein
VDLRQNVGVTYPTGDSKVLDDALLREIASTGGVKRYPANAVLINEGDAADTLFIVLSGRVKVYAGNESGKEVILNEHGPGEYVGEVPLDGGVRSASVMTLEPTTCALVTGANLREFIATHPDFALHLIRNLILRLRALTDSVKSLALDDVYGRVVGLLQRLAVAEDGQRAVPQRLTQQEIADRVGASREMVSRIFRELTVGGYLSVKAGRIVVLKNPPAAW